MGWAMLLLVALIATGALAALRVGRRLTTAIAAALVLGAAGYAWQGSPDTPSVLASGRKPDLAPDPNLIALRDALFGRFDQGHAFFVLADGLQRAGEPHLAAQAMAGAVRAQPQNAAMWTGLGMAIALNDGNQVSPAARLAFARARQLAPTHPGPPFFSGVTRLRAGDFAGARRDWALALRLCPPGTSYRRQIAERLALLDRFLAVAEQRR